MAWTFTVRREEGRGYARLEGTAENPERGQQQYWCCLGLNIKEIKALCVWSLG
jgi:hypothetical protein